MRKEIVVLEITSWGGMSFGAEHYYGKLKGFLNNVIVKIELNKILSQQEADYLNSKDNYGYKLKAGEKTTRFNTKQEVEDKAIEEWKKYFSYGEILLEGSLSTCDPQKCLAAQPELKKSINLLYEELESINVYEGNYKRASEIYKEYTKIVDEYFKR